MDHVLPLEDEDISIEAKKQFERNEIEIRTGAMVKSVTRADHGADIMLTAGEKEEILSAQTVLVSIGFSSNCENLRLEEFEVVLNNGKIEVDEQMRTSVDNIYGIGDANGKMGLAHVASAQGMIAVESITGHPTTLWSIITFHATRMPTRRLHLSV